jgi:hypothetical protein
MLLVAHPAIEAVSLEEAIFGDVTVGLEELGLRLLDLGEIVRVDARAPEVYWSGS